MIKKTIFYSFTLTAILISIQGYSQTDSSLNTPELY